MIQAVATPASTAVAGTLAGALTVKVTDQSGVAVSGTVVAFTISVGGGRVAPAIDTTKADGTASTEVTVGTTPGANEVTAIVSGVAPLKFAVTGMIGSTRVIALTPRALRFPVGQDNATISATPRDTFNNATGATVTWTARDPALLSVTPAGGGGTNNTATIAVLSRPGQTYVVASSGTANDSVLVSVQDASSTPCSFIATPTTLAVGGSIAFDSGLACVRSIAAGAEYVAVVHYNTAVSRASARVDVTGYGLAVASSAFPNLLPTSLASARLDASQPQRDVAFERALRLRERREIGPRVASARAWYRETRGARASAIRANVREGDLVTLNVNALDFCSNPQLRTARVAAITAGAVVLADDSNPPGGFTDDEYRAFGVAMDTLVNPVDTTAFGAPSDIDGNKRVAILFTSAVNDLTTTGSNGIVLGFYYIRDLLPKQSASGNCPGSNVSEMFYILVPDPNGTVNSNPRTKAFVESVAVATIGHEYQHLINASRRMYITNAPQVDEEVWLNEGLSHTAEELLFYHASGLSPRQNIGGSLLGIGSPTRAAFDTYERGNFGRYRQYLLAPESNSPVARNDVLATRGATWSFLRYLADRTRTTDGDFWRRLVNSQFIGVPNLDSALSGTGLTTLSALRDWSIAVLTDDLVDTDPAFQQPSWNFLSVIPTVGVSGSYPFAPRNLSDGVITVSGGQTGGANDYLRFAVAQNKEALIQATGQNGAQLPQGFRLTIVRIK